MTCFFCLLIFVKQEFRVKFIELYYPRRWYITYIWERQLLNPIETAQLGLCFCWSVPTRNSCSCLLLKKEKKNLLMTIKKNTQKHMLHQQLTGRFFGTTSYYEQQDSTSTVQTAAIFSPLMFPLGGFSLTVCSNESSAARAGETSARSPCRCHRRPGAKPRPHSSAEAD